VPRRAGYVDELKATMTERLGRDPMIHFDMDEGRWAALTPPDGFTPPDYSVYHRDDVGREGFTIDANGCGHLKHGFHHFTEYVSPLRHAASFKEIKAYPIVSNAGWRDDALRRNAEEAHAAGDYAATFVGHMYENAWQVRGYEAFLTDMVLQPEWAEWLLDRFCENNLRAAVAAARAGYDYIGTGDDVANQNALMFQPDLWRAMMKPRWAKVIAAARAVQPGVHIWYHSDGNVWAILDDLVEIGVTILNPVQPECMDEAAIRKRFGKRLAFDGCVGTQTTFPFGTPEDMRRRVRALVATLDGGQGGLMLSPTHVLEPEVPPANIIAFFEACDATAGKAEP
jgi:uroporphyrinogen decarboxylase